MRYLVVMTLEDYYLNCGDLRVFLFKSLSRLNPCEHPTEDGLRCIVGCKACKFIALHLSPLSHDVAEAYLEDLRDYKGVIPRVEKQD